MSAHATSPSALGLFFTYPADAAGTVEDYWRDAGGTSVRMTGACKRAFLATIEALIERAVVPANFGSVPSSTSALAGLTYSASVAPYSLINLGTWAGSSGRDALGALLARGRPYQVWRRLVSLTWDLFAATSFDSGPATVLSWQGWLLDFTTSGFIDALSSTWGTVYSRDWAGAASDDDVVQGGSGVIHPWGPYLGNGSSAVVENALQAMLDGLMSGVTVGGGSGNLAFAEDALNVSPDVMRMDGETPGNWFTQSASTRVGGVTWRRSANAWGVVQAMLAQMRYTHLVFPFEITYEHTEETRTVERVVGWDAGAMDWTCAETSDTTTTTTTTEINAITNRRGYGPAGGVAAEVTLNFAVDNSDADELSVLALSSPPSDVGPDGPYMVVGRKFLQHCTVRSDSPQAWTKSAMREFVSGVDNVNVNGLVYPATALTGYVGAYGPVHFADSLVYENSTTSETWSKYGVRPETGDADVAEPVTDHAIWLASHVPGVTLPSIAPFNQTIFSAAVADFWADMTAVYPTSPNVTIRGVQMYFPVGFYGYNGQLQTISLDPVDDYWKGQIRLGFGDVASVFPTDGDDVLLYAAQVAGSAIAGYEWQFAAMPTTS